MKVEDGSQHVDLFIRYATPPEGGRRARWGITRNELKGDGPPRVFVQGTPEARLRLAEAMGQIIERHQRTDSAGATTTYTITNIL